MTRPRFTSRQTLSVLSAFTSKPQNWRYGYDLSRETGVKSGTLYPMLIRLKEHGLLEAEWREASAAGRPPRHAYRLTRSGMALATSRLQAAKTRSPATQIAATDTVLA